jgi:hypothetical protein
MVDDGLNRRAVGGLNPKSADGINSKSFKTLRSVRVFIS